MCVFKNNFILNYYSMSITKLHTPLTKITLALFTAASSLVLSSCQDEDYGFTSDEVRASVYKRNFEGTYGEIDPNQTWDFSSYNLRKLGLTGGPSAATRGGALTRAAIDGLVTKYNDDNTKWYTVSDETTSWLNKNLKEKENNTKYVSSFNWEKVKDSDPLYIIPIYQGQTGMIWDLELVDLDNHTSSIIWSKSENFQYVQRYAQWDEFFYESWKSDEAPQTAFTNQYGKDDNKLKTLLFSKPLGGLPSSYNQAVVAAFSVGKISEEEDLDVAGSFFIKLVPDGNKYTEITSTNCSTFFNDADNKKMVESDGLFHFKTAGNVELNPPTGSYPYRTLATLNPNKVNLGNNILLGSDITIDGVSTKVTVDMLKTLKFEIEDSSYKLTYGADQKLDNKFGFNTWSPERIHVFVKYSDNEDVTINLQQDATNQYTEHHTINRYKVETRPIKIDLQKLVRNNNSDLSVNFALNLKTKYRGSGDSELSDIGDDHRSDMGFMSQINHFADADKPIDETKLKTALGEFGIHDLDGGFEYMVIGCEDAGANGKKSDNDYNDLVLLVVGKTLPTQTIRKRYMIEDLGSTLDFDFNDIVVDVTERVANTADGKKYTQTAAIRHLRGTIPFRVKIGNQGTFGAGDKKGNIMRGHNIGELTYDPSLVDAINANYKWEHTVIISGSSDDKIAKLDALRSNYWNPDANNIYVEVWPSYNSENNQLNDVFWTGADALKEDNSNATGNNVQNRRIVEFPKTGKVPYIIAVDPSVMWMEENISIPEYWIETHPEHFNNGFDQSDQTQDNVPAGSASRPEGNKINNTTSLPAGNFALSNTSTIITASNSLSIPVSAFNDVYVGDEIIVHVDGDKVYDKSRLDFSPSTQAIKKIGADGSIVVTGDYAIKVTQSLLNDLQTSGLQIGGQYVTVSKVDVKSDGGATKANNNSINQGSIVLSNKNVITSYSDQQVISKDKLYVGDKIIVKVSNLRNNSQVGFYKGNSWTQITNSTDYPLGGGLGDKYNWNNYPVNGDFTIDVTQQILNEGGIRFNGQYVTIESVSVQPAKDNNANSVVNPATISGGETIHSQRQVINYYDSNIKIEASKFNNLSEGDQIIVHVDNVRTNSALGFRDGSGNVVSWFGDSHGNKYYNANGEFRGDYALTVTSGNIESIKTNGIRITGAYINVTGVAIKKAPKTLYSGDFVTLNNYGEWLYFVSGHDGASKLAGAILDGYTNITFYFDANDGKIQFKTPKDKDGQGGWTVLEGTAEYGHLFSNGQYTLTITSDMTTQMNGGGGLIIQEGRNQSITITKVEASKP